MLGYRNLKCSKMKIPKFQNEYSPTIQCDRVCRGNFERSKHCRRKDKAYTRSKIKKCEIIDKNVEYSEKLVFKISNKEKDLPLMYWIPKMLKNPCWTRFIIVCNLCIGLCVVIMYLL